MIKHQLKYIGNILNEQDALANNISISVRNLYRYTAATVIPPSVCDNKIRKSLDDNWESIGMENCNSWKKMAGRSW